MSIKFFVVLDTLEHVVVAASRILEQELEVPRRLPSIDLSFA